MLITNGKVIVIANGDIDQLAGYIEQLEERFLTHLEKEVKFTYQDEPRKQFAVPDGITFEDLKAVASPDIELHFKIIGTETTKVPGTETREIKHIFDENEIMELGKRLAQLEKDKSVAIASMKQEVKRLKEGIEQIEIDIAESSSQIRESHKFVPMKVEASIDFDNKQKYFTAPGDTVVLSVLPLEPSDYQLRFLFPGEKAEVPEFKEVVEEIVESIETETDEENQNGIVSDDDIFGGKK